jgi:hypothetical protein
MDGFTPIFAAKRDFANRENHFQRADQELLERIKSNFLERLNKPVAMGC